MGGQLQISIVIPAFNEALRLPATLDSLASYLSGREEAWEVVIVVEKSPDETVELASRAAAAQANFRVIAHPDRRGKGYAVRQGMLAARGDIIFFMDADLSVPVEYIGEFFEFFAAHPETDVLAGNRQHSESVIARPQNMLRRGMGHAFNAIIRALSETGSRDTQCGFKAFRRAAARAIFERQRINGFAFDVEVLMLARQLGLRVEDHPVRWVNSEQSTVRLARDGLRMLRDVIGLRAGAARAKETKLVSSPGDC